MSPGQDHSPAGPSPGLWTSGSLASAGTFLATAFAVLAGVLLFYGSLYSVHQDLAGSALSGRLAIALGDSFGEYASYFPPVERLWFELAARLSLWSGLRLDLTVLSMTGIAVLFSGALAYRIRRETVGASPLFVVGSVAVLVILPILFKNIFGLREHFVALGLWPYLVLRISDPDGTQIGRTTRAVLGLWLGATLLFKYLYSAVVLLVELVDAAMRRRPHSLLRIENIVAGSVVALYLFVWLVLDPTQRAVMSAVVSAIDANLLDRQANLRLAAAQLPLALLLLLAARFFRLPMRETLIGFALVVGSVFAAWMQARWYSHHLFPITLAYIAWWWMVGRGLKWWGHVMIAAIVAMPIVSEFRNTASYQKDVAELDTALDRAGLSVEGKKVGILAMHPSPYNQYLAAHDALRWIASMNNSYVAAELKDFDRRENARKAPPPVMLRDPGRRMLHDEMLRLWEDSPPDILILDHSTRWPLRYIDVEWRHVFSKDARFKAILAQYRPVYVHKGKRLEFRYYVRADRRD